LIALYDEQIEFRLLDSYGLVLQSQYELFGASKFQSTGQKLSDSLHFKDLRLCCWYKPKSFGWTSPL